MVGERGGGSGLGGNMNDGAVRTCMEGEKDYLKGRERRKVFWGLTRWEEEGKQRKKDEETEGKKKD